jgi:hypothetical protein
MEEKNPILVGNVWHNLGTAYARLFLCEEAVSCFERAYEKNENPESLRECLFACLCMTDESAFMRVTEKFQVTEELEREIRQEWFHMNQAQESSPTVLEMEELFRRGTESDIGDRLLAWKNDYRSSCRV